MAGNRAPGPDGVPIEFYQKCWHIIKNDLMEFFEDLCSHKLDLSRINFGVIILLPKTEDA